MPTNPEDDFKQYLHKARFVTQDIKFTNNKIVISMLPYASDILFNVVILGVFVYGLFIKGVTQREIAIPAWIVMIIQIIYIWARFNAINYVTINCAAKIITIRSKNPLIYAVKGKKVYNFSDIESVTHNPNAPLARYMQYPVYMYLKGSDKKIIIIDFKRQANTITFARKLNAVVTNTH